jgi:hypothetical protein
LRVVPEGDVDVLVGDVHRGEEIVVHEAVITLLVLRVQPHVLVQVEGGHLGKIKTLLLVHAHQFLVQPERGRTGGHPDHRVGLGVQHVGHVAGRGFAHRFVSVTNDHFHG